MPVIRNLDNSLRTVMENIPHFRSASLGMWVDIGSAMEEEENQGLCHVLEHMVFKGTQKRTAAEIAAYTDILGGHMNAYTSKEHTCFYTKVIDEHFALAYDLLSDMILNPKLDEQDLENEKKVIIEEIRMTKDEPEELVHDLLAKAYFQNHKLAHPISGEIERIQTVTARELRDFFESNYTADNILISAAGSVDEAVFSRLTDTTFSHLPLVNQDKTRAVYEKDEQVYCELSNKDIEQTHICLGYRGVKMGDERSYAMLVLSSILGSGISSRLFRRIREEKGLVYSVYSFPAAFRDGGMFGIYAAMNPENVEETLKIIHEELQQICELGVSEEEFERAREQIKGSYILSQDSVAGKMNAMGNSMLFRGRVQSEEEVLAKIAKVDQKAVQEIAQYMFSYKGTAAAAVGPFKGRQGKRIEALLNG